MNLKDLETKVKDILECKGDCVDCFLCQECMGEVYLISKDLLHIIEVYKSLNVIKIGDYVEIIDDYKQYSMYEEFMGSFENYKKCFIQGGNIDVSKQYKVVGVDKHPSISDILYIVQDQLTLQVFIMSEEGIRIVDTD